MKEITCCDIATGKYFIDEDGNIFSMYKNGYVKGQADKDGYIRVLLKTNNKDRRFSVHKLVALTFLGDPPQNMTEPTVDHKDGVRTHNSVDNLQWKEKRDNIIERHKKPIGENNGRHKLTENDVKQIIKELLDGKECKDICINYGVKKEAIRDIKNKIHWKYLTENIEFN